MYGNKPQCPQCGNTTSLSEDGYHFICNYCSSKKRKYKYKKKSDRRIKKDMR